MKSTAYFVLGALASLVSSYAQAAFLPVCSRTPAVKEFLEAAVKKPCAEMMETDLLGIKRVAVNGKKIAAFNADDFTGLANLEILNIRSNPYTELPEGLFKDLAHLKTLVIIETKLRHYPDDFLADTPEIENVHTFRNEVRTISESVFQRLENAKALAVLDVDDALAKPEKDRLTRSFQGRNVELNFN